MENMRGNDYWLELFNIKPCALKLDRMEFKKIRMQCTATSLEQDVKLKCDITQKDTNTFSISIKRVLLENVAISGTPNEGKCNTLSENVLNEI